jgi:hypothetical protein
MNLVLAVEFHWYLHMDRILVLYQFLHHLGQRVTLLLDHQEYDVNRSRILLFVT